MKVFVYFNLHKKVWSIKALEGDRKGRVIAHSEFVVLGGATPKVSQAGRERVIREGRKNVHAGLVGQWLNSDPAVPVSGEAFKGAIVPYHITYNPYKYRTFVYKDAPVEAEWEGSPIALLNASDRQVIVFNPTEFRGETA